jgi:dGTPase
MLSHLRFPAEESRGRRYPEPGHAYRDAFQRDRDRIIHTRAFRRLENKTQVFAPGISDHFRNRLTHTLEVSQIARTAANVLGLNEDLTEALALVHDVGHPQKGGERFDHNIQALRIVETLEQRYPRFPGLNLTFEVREGIVKHSRDFAPGELPALDEYLPGLRPPLEAQLIALADEVAYNAADLDEAYEAVLLNAPQIAEAVPAYAELLDTIETQFPGATGREQFQESVRHLIDDLVSGLINGTVAAVKDAGVSDIEAVRWHPSRLARFTAETRQTSLQLKRFLLRNVYSSEALDHNRRDSIAKLDQLFEYLLAHPEKIRAGGDSGEESPRRAVCDFLAGMTDRYCLRFYDTVFQSSTLE